LCHFSIKLDFFSSILIVNANIKRLFDWKDSSEILTKGYEDALLLVTQAIDTIMTGEGLDDRDLVISKLLRQDIQKYRSLFPHVYAAIQSRKYPVRGDTIQYIYTESKHNFIR